MVYDDLDELVPEEIDEEASFHFMIMDLHHFIQKGLIQKIHTKLPVESKEILYKFYAGKC